MARFRYDVIGNNVIKAKINEDFEVISIARWNKVDKIYTTTLLLNEIQIDQWDLIDEGEIFESTISDINKDMLRSIEQKYDDGFFDRFIERYLYTQKCFAKGNEFYESERINSNV